MGVAWARVGLVLLVLAVAIPSATVLAQRGGEGGPIPERDTTCWPCHVGWSPPLKTFYNILPPPEAGAAVGQPFEYVIQLQGAWTPPGNGPDILYYEPTLDLSGAPSLGFFSDSPPVSEDLAGEVPPATPPDLTAPRRSEPLLTVVPLGTTDLTIVLEPQDVNSATGPDLILNAYPGLSAPSGTPAITVDSAGRGGTETLTLQGAEAFRAPGLSYGNWTLEVVAKAPAVGGTDPTALLNLPAAQPQPFTIAVDSAIKDTGERSQAQPIRETVVKGGSALIRYNLLANAPPAPGEVVRVVVNTTVYYKHNDAGTDNYANVTKAYSADIPVEVDGERTVIRTALDPSTLVAGGTVQNGATLDTMSEGIGYGTAFLLISSIWTGGMFGKASRRSLNGVFGTAKRRVAFHNFLSYGLMLFASVHTVLFIIEATYYWTLGLIWGGLALLAMLMLGVTGAFQVQMIRRWNYNFWRWSHYGLAVAAIVFTLVHMALDGVHFGFIQERIGWDDPLDPRNVG